VFVKGKVLSRCRAGSKGTEILEAKTGGELGVICTIDVCILAKSRSRVSMNVGRGSDSLLTLPVPFKGQHQYMYRKIFVGPKYGE